VSSSRGDCVSLRNLQHEAVTGAPEMPSSQGVRFLLAAAGALYDPGKAKQLLAAAGFPKGFDAGNYYCDSSYANIGEAVVNNLLAVGIRSQLRPVERAAFLLAIAPCPGLRHPAARRIQSLAHQLPRRHGVLNSVVSTRAPLDFARGKLSAERRDLLSTISGLSSREGLSTTPLFERLRSRRR
jgi:hypothetical protein